MGSCICGHLPMSTCGPRSPRASSDAPGEEEEAMLELAAAERPIRQPAVLPDQGDAGTGRTAIIQVPSHTKQ